MGVVKQLIKNGAKVNAKNSYGNSPIIMASSFDNVDVVKFLLSKGAQFSKQDLEAVLKVRSKEEMIEAGYYWDLHDATYR